MTFFTHIRDSLNGVYPGLWNAAVGVVVVTLIWLLKKLAPNLFDKLPPAVQALPAVFLSGMISGLSAAAPLIGDFLAHFAVGGMLGGTLAVGAHHMLKESPLPYGRPKPDSLKPSAVTHITLVLLAMLTFIGCSPSEMQTAVSVAEDVVKIAQVLCLADQAKTTHADVRALSVQDLCNTTAELAPYMPAAETPRMMSASGICP